MSPLQHGKHSFILHEDHDASDPPKWHCNSNDPHVDIFECIYCICYALVHPRQIPTKRQQTFSGGLKTHGDFGLNGAIDSKMG